MADDLFAEDRTLRTHPERTETGKRILNKRTLQHDCRPRGDMRFSPFSRYERSFRHVLLDLGLEWFWWVWSTYALCCGFIQSVEPWRIRCDHYRRRVRWPGRCPWAQSSMSIPSWFVKPEIESVVEHSPPSWTNENLKSVAHGFTGVSRTPGQKSHAMDSR